MFKGTFAQDEYSFVGCNRYFITEELHQSVTRMMNVAFGGDCNRVLGASLDHGTINILGDENINNVMTGRAIFPNPDMTTTANGQFGFFTKDYAGGPCAISTINLKSVKCAYFQSRSARIYVLNLYFYSLLIL